MANVSDTARWVAVYRAWESARPDALFKDPLADRLAGDRGRAIAALAPRQARSGWPMIARTVGICFCGPDEGAAVGGFSRHRRG